MESLLLYESDSLIWLLPPPTLTSSIISSLSCNPEFSVISFICSDFFHSTSSLSLTHTKANKLALSTDTSSSFTHHPREKNNKKRKPVFCLYILTYSYFDPWSLAFIITLTLTHMTEQLKLHFTESSFTKFAFWLSNQLKIFRFSFNTWGYLTLARPLNHKSVILWSIC